MKKKFNNNNIWSWKKKKESKGIILGFVGRETSNEKKTRMQQLTNFNETIRPEIWNQFKLQFFI